MDGLSFVVPANWINFQKWRQLSFLIIKQFIFISFNQNFELLLVTFDYNEIICCQTSRLENFYVVTNDLFIDKRDRFVATWHLPRSDYLFLLLISILLRWYSFNLQLD